MEAADSEGCETEPLQNAACDGKTSQVAKSRTREVLHARVRASTPLATEYAARR